MTIRPTILAFLARTIAGVACCAGALLGGVAGGQVIPKDMPEPVRGLEVENHSGRQVPLALQFTDEAGRMVGLGDYFDRPAANGKAKKPLVVQMLYYRCPILCPTVLRKFTETIQRIDFTVGRDFDVVLASVDARDTPADATAQKAAQVIAYNRPGEDVRDGWHFLTSKGDSPRRLADALGFPYRYIPESGEYAHGACLFVLTPEGKISRYFTGLNYPSSDVRLALLEASGGKIGTVFDAFTLWCYHFDPSTGKYTLAAMRVMRAGGAASVLFIGGVILAMWRFEVRKKRRLKAAALESAAPSDSPSLPGGPATLTGSMS
ncbi:MAG TPA: SCO family protein [Phycisphaerales bacterium]|nr:SCO family protein [Phycisphaerales bacterium]